MDLKERWIDLKWLRSSDGLVLMNLLFP